MKEPLLYRITRPLITGLVKIIFHPQIMGKENIKKADGLVLVSNHTSYFDPLLLIASTPRCVHFLAKHTLDKGLKKIIFHHMGIIFVNRTKKNPEAVKKAIAWGKEKEVLAIFPEGTINKTNDILMPFKMGAVKIAKEANIWVVPVAISGKYRLFSRDLKITFGKSYKITSEDLEKENALLRAKIIRLLERK